MNVFPCNFFFSWHFLGFFSISHIPFVCYLSHFPLTLSLTFPFHVTFHIPIPCDSPIPSAVVCFAWQAFPVCSLQSSLQSSDPSDKSSHRMPLLAWFCLAAVENRCLPPNLFDFVKSCLSNPPSCFCWKTTNISVGEQQKRLCCSSWTPHQWWLWWFTWIICEWWFPLMNYS